jgi:WD40 repeat protein
MSSGQRTFRIFVSSTFSDLKAERDALQQDVFPRLTELCRDHGYSFQAIDLRWGISEEAALDQQTMNICLDELRRCQRLSPRPNFIVLLGNRYGWRPLPPQVPADEFEELLKFTGTPEERALLCCPPPPVEPEPGRHWYRRDDNAVPASYVLRPRTLDGDGPWDTLESQMRAVLSGAMTASGWPPDDPRRQKYEHSATHQEIDAGLLASSVAGAEEHVFAFVREATVSTADASAAEFLDIVNGTPDPDAVARLRALKRELEDRLGLNSATTDGHLFRYDATWTPSGPTTNHLEDLSRDVYASLSRMILSQVKQLEGISETDTETQAREAFETERHAVFEGRTDMLRQIHDYCEDGTSHPLVLHGPSGSGKTSLMARAAYEATERGIGGRAAQVVVRYLGITPKSSELRFLLEDLCRHLGPASEALPTDVRGLGVEFGARLKWAAESRPVALFLDGLDQLNESDGASTLWWLPRDLPPNVKVIVSVLEAPTESGRSLESARGRTTPDHLIAIPAWLTSDAERALEGWLRLEGRALQPIQKSYLLSQFAESGEALPLYLRLAFEDARRWKSYEPPRELPSSVDGLFDDLFERLSREENHGATLTMRALGYLSAGRRGLAENELLDLLSRDAEVLADFRRRAPNSPSVPRLPFIVWARLRAQLAPYLVERESAGATVLGFYHLQMSSSVRRWALSGSNSLRSHAALAAYFETQPAFLESLEDQRQRSRTVPPTPRPANRRRADELAWQSIRSEKWEDASRLLTSLPVLESKTEAGLVFDLAADFAEFARRAPAKHADRILVELLGKALQRDIHFVSQHPTTLFQTLWNCAWWYDCDEGLRHYASAPLPVWRLKTRVSALLEAWHELKQSVTPEFTWVRTKRPPSRHLGSPELAVFRGHEYIVLSVDVIPPGDRIISGSGDNTIRVWDRETGAELLVLAGHEDWVTSVAATPNGTKIVSGSFDHTIRVWNLATGESQAVLRGHEDRVYDVAVSAGGRHVISGSDDRTVRVWEMATGTERAVFRGHEAEVRCVAITLDGSRIVSGSNDGTIRVWDPQTGTATAVLHGHEQWVNSVAVTPDGTRVLSASVDGTIRIWDLTTGAVLSVLRGHEDAVNCVAVTPNGAHLVSGSADGTVRVWDTAKEAAIATFRGHVGSIDDVAITPSGAYVVTCGTDRTIRMWDITGESDAASLFDQGEIHSARAVTPDGRRLITGSDGFIRVWDLRTGLQLALIRGEEAGLGRGAGLHWIMMLAISSDGRYAVGGCYDSTVRVWDLDGAVECSVLRGHTGTVVNIAVAGDPMRIASGSEDNSIRVWDLATGAEVAVLRGHERSVRAVAVTADGTRVVSGSNDGTVRLWDIAAATELGVMRGHDDGVWKVALTPDGMSCVTGSFDRTIRIWSLATQTEIAVLRGHSKSVEQIIVSADGKRIVSSDGELVRVWDFASGECLETIVGQVDLSSLAAGTDACPYRAVVRDSETVFERSSSGETVSWFPGDLRVYSADSKGRIWGDSRSDSVSIVTLEGHG